jgi:WD40 repeat protein/serine/threonine protein kinase
VSHVNRSLIAAVLAVRQGAIPAERAAELLASARDESEALERVENELRADTVVATVAVSPSLVEIVAERLEEGEALSGLGFDETTVRTLSDIRRLTARDPVVRDTLLSISPTRMVKDLELEEMPLIDADDVSETSRPTVAPRPGEKVVTTKKPSSQILRAVAREERYTIEKEHARGGMGRILIARDNVIGRDVALKELLPQRQSGGSIPQQTESSRGLTERFLREAKVTGQLEHPNIVSVYEIGKNDDDTLYYTMKFVRGQTLAARLHEIAKDSTLDKKEKLAARLKVLDNFVDVCNAIAYAHNKGVIHRDLKPENVMLGDYGETIVLDWGLARVRGQEDTVAQKLIDSTRFMSQSVLQSETDKLTIDGSIVGTPAYMSPEQARGELDEIDEKSDVYALGAVLYQILCGRPPFDGPMAGLIIQQVLHSKPLRMSAVAPEVPPELEALVERAMAKDKTERLASAREFASEVKAFRDGRTITSYSYSARELMGRWVTRHKRTVIVVAILVYALIAGAVFHYVQLREEQRELAASILQAQNNERLAIIASSDAARATEDAQKARKDAETQARTALAETAEKERALLGWDQTLADAYAMRIRLGMEQNDQNSALAFAAASLGSAEQAEARGALLSTPNVTPLLWNLKTDAPGGQEIFQFHSVVFSPDGRLVASGMADGRVWLWSTETGETHQVLTISEAAAHAVAFSPDGSVLVAGTGNGFIRFWDLDAATGRYEHKSLDLRMDNNWRVNSLNFSPDGTKLFAGGITSMVIDSATRVRIGPLEEVKNHEAMFVSASPNGRWVISTSLRLEDLFVRVYDPGTFKFVRALLDQTSYNEMFTAWAPDGSMLATSTLHGRIVLRDGATLRMTGTLNNHTSAVLGVAFSPDSKLLLTSSADGTVRCWDVATQEEVFVLSGFVDWVEAVAFAPDGLSFCTRGRSGGVQVWAMPGIDQQALVGHLGDVMDVRHSPDGSKFVSAGWDGTVVLWDVQTRKPIRTHSASLTQFFCADFLDEDRVVAGSSDGVFVWSVRDGKELAHVAGREYVPDITLSDDRRTFMYAQWRQAVWRDSATLEVIWETRRHAQMTTSIALSPDAKLFATASYDGWIYVSDAGTREIVCQLDAAAGPIFSLLFTPDSKQLIAAYDDRVARVWDLEKKEVVHLLRGHEGIVFCLRYDPDCKLLFSTSQDRSVRVWNAVDYSPVAVLKGHDEIVSRLSVSPDGHTLLTASQDDTIRAWQLDQLSISNEDFALQAYATTGLVVREKEFAVRLDPNWPAGVEDNRVLLAARMQRGNEVRRYRQEFEARFEGYRYRNRDGARQYLPPRRKLPSGLFEGPAQGTVNYAAWWADQHPEWTRGYERAPIVTEVSEEGQGPDLGLRIGDVIWTVDGERVTDKEDLRVKLEALADRDDYIVVVRRYARDKQGRMLARQNEKGDLVLNQNGETEWDMTEGEYTFKPGKLGMRIGDTGVMARPFR